jgi:hypothetical protein
LSDFCAHAQAPFEMESGAKALRPTYLTPEQ